MGTELQFISSLKGDKGDAGVPGESNLTTKTPISYSNPGASITIPLEGSPLRVLRLSQQTLINIGNPVSEPIIAPAGGEADDKAGNAYLLGLTVQGNGHPYSFGTLQVDGYSVDEVGIDPDLAEEFTFLITRLRDEWNKYGQYKGSRKIKAYPAPAFSFDVTSSNASTPTGHGYNERFWVTADRYYIFFFTDGNHYLATRTRLGTTWSISPIIFDTISARCMGIAFDGEYFHFAAGDEATGNVRYRRGKWNTSTNVFDLGIVRTAWTAAGGRTAAAGHHAAVGLNGAGQPYIGFQTQVTVGTDVQREPWAVAGTMLPSGGLSPTWSTRTGFPVSIKTGTIVGINHGMVQAIVELGVQGSNQMLFVWFDIPNNRTTARLYDNTAWGAEQLSELLTASATLSAYKLTDGGILISGQSSVSGQTSNLAVARFRPQGETGAKTFSPAVYVDIPSAAHGGITGKAEVLRLWSRDGSKLIYKESPDNGASWGLLQQIEVDGTLANVISNQGLGGVDGHKLLWRQGSSAPYNIKAHFGG